MTEVRMPYKRYKTSYADCSAVSGTYDSAAKSIVVEIPEGRMKPSGVRGRSFRTIYLMVGADAQHVFEQGFRAIDYSHALKQARRQYAFVADAR